VLIVGGRFTINDSYKTRYRHDIVILKISIDFYGYNNAVGNKYNIIVHINKRFPAFVFGISYYNV